MSLMSFELPSGVSSSIDPVERSLVLNKVRHSVYIDFVHVYAVRAIYDLLIERDINPEDVFEQAEIDSRIFTTLEVTSFASLGRLTAVAASQTQCAHFGLLVGQRTTLASLGLLGSLLRHSETVGDALRALETHHDQLNRGALIEVSSDAAAAIVRYSPYEPAMEGIALHCERALAALTNVLRSLCGPDWTPDEVLLPRLEPLDAAPYASFFHCPVRFGQEIAALVFPARFLRQPIAGANPIIRNAVERRIRRREAVIPTDMAAVVRRQVRSATTQGRTNKDQVAQTFEINKRTLSRRLKAEGTSFRSVANQTRLYMAKQLLADTNLSMTEISAALEFSELAAFTHAFRRWTGTTPSAWRRER